MLFHLEKYSEKIQKQLKKSEYQSLVYKTVYIYPIDIAMRWIIFISIYLIVDIYAFQAVRTLVKNPWLNGLYAFVSIGVLLSLIFILVFSMLR